MEKHGPACTTGKRVGTAGVRTMGQQVGTAGASALKSIMRTGVGGHEAGSVGHPGQGAGHSIYEAFIKFSRTLLKSQRWPSVNCKRKGSG